MKSLHVWIHLRQSELLFIIYYLLRKGAWLYGRNLSGGKSVRVLISYSFRWWARIWRRAEHYGPAPQLLAIVVYPLPCLRVRSEVQSIAIIVYTSMCIWLRFYPFCCPHRENELGEDRERRMKERTCLTRYLNVNRQTNGPRTPLAFRAERQEKENMPRFGSKVMKTFIA